MKRKLKIIGQNFISIEKIINIAIQVRRAVEVFAKTDKNHDVGGNPENLCCYCAIASYALMTALKKQGIKCRLISGFFDETGEYEEYEEKSINHCWVEVNNKILDITASQFPEHRNYSIVILPNNKSIETGYYPLEYPKTLKELIDGWTYQSPRIKYTKKILKLAKL